MPCQSYLARSCQQFYLDEDERFLAWRLFLSLRHNSFIRYEKTHPLTMMNQPSHRESFYVTGTILLLNVTRFLADERWIWNWVNVRSWVYLLCCQDAIIGWPVQKRSRDQEKNGRWLSFERPTNNREEETGGWHPNVRHPITWTWSWFWKWNPLETDPGFGG